MIASIQILNPNVINLLNHDMRKLAKDLSSRGRLRQPFEKIRNEVMIPSIDKNFEVGGRVGGQRWEPIAPMTEERRKGPGGPPLSDTGQMRRAGTAKARFSIKGNTMTYGNWPSKRWFGPVHDLAELARAADIPQRQFVLIQEEDANAIQEIMLEWVEKMVNQNIRLHYA